MKNNILNLAIMLTVGVILAGSLLMPVISDAQQNAGAIITKSNVMGDYLYSDYSEEDLSITVTYDADNGNTFTINDTTYDDYEAQTVLIADTFILNLNASDNSTTAGLYTTVLFVDDEPTSRVYQALTETLTISYSHENSTLTYTYGTASAQTVPTSTVLAVNDDGNYVYVPSTSLTSVYATEEYIESGDMGSFAYRDSVTVGDDTLVCRIFVSDGTVYAYLWNGNTLVTDDYNVTFSVDGLEIAEGTTDILTGGQPTITIENISTGDIGTIDSGIAGIVIKEVSGHAASGAAYSLYGAIPIIVIVAIVVASIGMVVARRD